MPSARRTPPVALALHGGAGPQSEEAARERLDGLLPAVEAGWEVLISGGGALEAAVAAVVVLEDDPRFNAGLGSALTREGTIEMDALVMEGPERRAGAVAAVRHRRHPGRHALRVLEAGEHVILSGVGASRFARETGETMCDPAELVTPRARERLAAWLRERRREEGSGTVGALTLDARGRLASATSTGGRIGRTAGRIGDTPVPGAGGWADACAAVSATGIGEAILRTALSLEAARLVAGGAPPGEAARRALRQVRALGASAGLVVLDARGRTGAACTGAVMPVARRSARGRSRAGIVRG